MDKNIFKEHLHENKKVFEQNAYYGAVSISDRLNFGFVNMRKSYNKLKKNTVYGAWGISGKLDFGLGELNKSHNKFVKNVRYGIRDMTKSYNKYKPMYRYVILGSNDDDCGIVIKNYDKTVYAVYNGNEFIYKEMSEKNPIIHNGSLTDICNFILKG